MKQQRKDQAGMLSKYPLTGQRFLEHVVINVDTGLVADYFLVWLKIMLDAKCRKTLPGLQKEYKQEWTKYRAKKSNPTADNSQINVLETNLRHISEKIDKRVIGIEHLFRELGQMYEALQEFKKKIDSATWKNLELLPRAVAKLILRGHTLEIMDGDASNIPLNWVQAVFCQLSEVTGDKKILTISVLGVQSSGKSTLLNTMFGVQFSVSAGRCTRGVFAQLLPVQSVHWKPRFDYILVIDTEGIGSPELGIQKHTHDNELATLTLGLGNMTIINIKGENTEQMKDALEIAMQAFLRMKMADNKVAGNHRCMFVHNNVSAINAEKQNMHALQTLDKTLDEIMKEVAKQEGISAINGFRDVIDIDLEKHVWYLTDLWEGSPPMAPVNQKYASKVATMKEIILKLGSEIKCLTMACLGFRIKDLWNAILQENFIFSFRNSLESKAYSMLQRKFLKIMRGTEREAEIWVQKEAQSLIVQCETESELTDKASTLRGVDLPSMISTIREKSTTQVNQMFDGFDEDLKPYVIQWKQSKINEMDCKLTEIKDKSSGETKHMTERRRVELLSSIADATREAKFLNAAKGHAKKLKAEGKENSSETAPEEVFEQMWTHWEKELNPDIFNEKVKIHDILHNMLFRTIQDNHHCLLKKQLKERPLISLPEKNCKRKKMEGLIELYSVQVHFLSYKHVLRHLSPFPRSGNYKKVVGKINKMLGTLDIKLESQLSPSIKRFQEGDFRDILSTFLSKIEEINTNDKVYSIAPAFKVHLVVTIAQFSLAAYSEQQYKYLKKHSVAAKLEQFKKTCKNQFLNEFKSSTQSLVAADFFCDASEERLKEVVEEETKQTIVKLVTQKIELKENLICEMCTELVNMNDFERFMKYITNPKNYTREWLSKQIKEHASELARHAADVTDDIVCKVKIIVRDTESDFTVENDSLHNWVHSFCDNDFLYLPKEKLRHVEKCQITDYTEFEARIIERMNDIAQQLKAEWNSLSTIEWVDKSPDDIIMDSLWGCGELCPFCAEPCTNTIAFHTDAHQCLQHRPLGINGPNLEKQMSTSTCNFNVCSDESFECYEMCHSEPEKKKEMHCYKAYKSIFKWNIVPTKHADRNKYWCWFMATFENDLKRKYHADLTVPSSWKSLSKEEAIESLRMTYEEKITEISTTETEKKGSCTLL